MSLDESSAQQKYAPGWRERYKCAEHEGKLNIGCTACKEASKAFQQDVNSLIRRLHDFVQAEGPTCNPYTILAATLEIATYTSIVNLDKSFEEVIQIFSARWIEQKTRQEQTFHAGIEKMFKEVFGEGRLDS